MTITDSTIRPATLSDLGRIKEIAVAAEMFSVDEAEFFDEMVNGALDGSLEDHQWLVVETSDGAVVGAAQFAPEPFADRMWNLYFIAVDPSHQGTGIGSALMAHVEADLAQRGEDLARTLVVETSSTDQYARTRSFYAGIGYDEEARIRQFYGPDDHKVVFWKQINGGSQP
jgi:ribosomal protein S18 acetylase RimI-like enzyme